MVFANRPKDYGAYEMRESSSKRHVWAIIITFILVVVVSQMPAIMEQVKRLRPAAPPITADTQLSDLNQEIEDQNKIQQETTPPPPPLKATIAFVAPEIVDQVKPEEQVKSQEQLQDSKADISLFNVEGDDSGLGVDKAELEAQQRAAAEKVDNKVYDFVEQMPSFPGGEKELMKFLHDHIKYPQLALENGISGTVVVQFTVNTDGSITNVTTLTSPHKSLADEAIRLISSMPKWIPGKQNGNAVRVNYRVPVVFQLQQ